MTTPKWQVRHEDHDTTDPIMDAEAVTKWAKFENSTPRAFAKRLAKDLTGGDGKFIAEKVA